MYQYSKLLLCIIFAACISCAVGLDFTGANWIWIPGREADGITYPPGNASFRRDLTPTNGKVPISANILITTDNAYTLYVNGKPIGTGIDFRYAQRYCVPLSHCCNVFAVEGQNYQPNAPGNAAGVLAAIQIRYSDGFTDTIVTDAEWHAVNGSPAGFQEVAYDDSSWAPAFVEGPYPSTAPWNSYTISIPPPDQNPGPSLQSAKWIWTNELTGPGSSVPVGARAFRKTINIPDGGLVVQAHVLIATDNEFTLYINGLLVGSGSSFTTANRYLVNFPPTSTVTIAVYAVNTGGPAGVFGAFELITCDCSSNVYGVTDETWKFNLGTPDGFIQPGYNDGAWGSAVTEGGFGASPWGPTTAPAANSPQSAALPGAPSAPPADVVV
ncbi:hypothetical protein H0H92_008370 [Tricholoma furcatifolium]|nr:hypothetical protein H0H92_008370 [Tricholoma furcatifolium]